MKAVIIAFLLSTSYAAIPSSMVALDESTALALHQMEAAMADKIQTGIVDPVLGKGNAFVFADINLELIVKKAEQSKSGMGQLIKSAATQTEEPRSEPKQPGKKVSSNTVVSDDCKTTDNDLFKGFDFGNFSPTAEPTIRTDPEPQRLVVCDKQQISSGKCVIQKSATGQQVEQAKSIVERRLGVEKEITYFSLKILHDDSIPAEKLKLLKKAILTMMPRIIRKQDNMSITFHPVPFLNKDRKEASPRKRTADQGWLNWFK